ncbi:unnamed protein product [Polarella glacialis]|nr:unnamed protein product [Polarella glacialis]
MKGEDYLDQSPWPINWMDNMQGILRSMTFMKQHELQAEPWRGMPARKAVAERVPHKAGSRGLKVAIVSVCDYDSSQTPLARLSQLNKEAYARMHGYEVVMYDKAPVFEDPLSELLTEPPSHRPPAWSKVDALLATMAKGQHDWVMWMDCDSFFMDPEVSLEDMVAAAESRCDGGGAAAKAATSSGADNGDLAGLKSLVNQWLAGPEARPDDLLSWYDDLLERDWQTRPARDRSQTSCGTLPPLAPPVNRTLGWADWLFAEGRPQVIASEDGLMLNTGIVLVRASTWSWQFFQKVRWMTFGRSPVTQHPWWEQTAMVYLLQMPFVLSHAAAWNQQLKDFSPLGPHPGYAPAVAMLSQKHINGYPPIVASALLTHEVFEPGDFIVSFSGCKVYSSQEVCNQLFLNYFFQVHSLEELAKDPGLQAWL